jgi:hypothetical protein
MHVQGEFIDDAARIVQKEVGDVEPRSFIGWASSAAFMARAFNRAGRYAEARNACELVLPHITDADRDYVMIFLDADLEMVIADAGLGNFDRAVARIDGLLTRFKESDNPLVQGKLHETRARVAIMAGRMDDYRHHLSLADHWFRGTGTPALIAAAERLAALGTSERGSLPDDQAFPAAEKEREHSQEGRKSGRDLGRPSALPPFRPSALPPFL